MLSLTILLKAFSSILVLFGVFYFCGQLVCTNRVTVKNLNVQFIFQHMLIGLLFLVSLFAIFQTGLKTILLPVPIVLLIFYRKTKTVSTESSFIRPLSLLML